MLIHYKTSFEHDDNPGCVAFNAALAALAQGHEVEMLYDAGGVFDLKLWHGEPVAYHYQLPDKLKRLLSERFSIPVSALPRTYREYLHWLHAMGVKISYNGFMAALVDLQPSVMERSEQIEPVAAPLGLKAMVERIAQSDIYLAY